MALFSDEYDFVNAKVHGMRSRLYEADRLSGLLSCTGLPELLQILSPRRGEVFAGDVAVERILTAQYFQALDEVCEHMSGRSKALIEAILLRRSVENVKVALQFWHMTLAKESLPGPVENYMVPDPHVALPPMAELLQSATLSDLAGKLPWDAFSPDFAEALEPAIERYEKDHVVFYVLVAIDKAYFELLWRRVQALRRDDRAVAREIVGTELDIHNIFAVMRLRLNYDLPPEEVLALLPVHGRLLTGTTLAQMCWAEDSDAIIARLPGVYQRVFEGVTGEFGDSQRSFWDHLYRLANRTFYRSMFNIGAVLGFYVFKKIEFMNLASVIQGYRYELSAGAIRSGLIPLAR